MLPLQAGDEPIHGIGDRNRDQHQGTVYPDIRSAVERFRIDAFRGPEARLDVDRAVGTGTGRSLARIRFGFIFGEPRKNQNTHTYAE